TVAGPSNAKEFNYTAVSLAVPEIDSIDPPLGTRWGGTTVRLYGRGFDSVSGVLFGADPAASFKIISDSVIEAVAPAFTGNTARIANSVGIVLLSPYGNSEPEPFLYIEDERADPSQDPDVRAVVNAHISAADRFMRVQSGSVTSRLRSVRNLRFNGTRTNDFNFRLVNSMPRLDEEQRRQAYAQLRTDVSTINCTDVFRSSGSESRQTPWSFWSDGSVNIGSNDDDGGFDYTTFNLTLGADYALNDSFVIGFAGGYTDDKTDIGNLGSETSGYAWSGMIYASYSPTRSLYLEGMLGYSSLHLDSERYTANGFAKGDRGGDQYFASAAAGYDFVLGNFLLSPFGKFQAARSTLDGYSESGGGNLAIRYGKTDVDMLAGGAGVRSEYAFRQAWGSINPWVEGEYSYDFKGSANVRLGYTDQLAMPYMIQATNNARNSFGIGGGVNFSLPHRLNLGVEYRGTFANNRDNHRFAVQASWSW
ncbi:MAG: autotransporter domain-containing protein, partial [Planctomycetes bacterium]|nr:autotransporter domain-containing protein [Planctomycetota bacterium]